MTQEVENLAVEDSPQPSNTEEKVSDAPAEAPKKRTLSTESTETVHPVKEPEVEKAANEEKPAEK